MQDARSEREPSGNVGTNFGPLSRAQVADPLTAAEEALAHFDERLAKSPIREGWLARTHSVRARGSKAMHLDDLVRPRKKPDDFAQLQS